MDAAEGAVLGVASLGDAFGLWLKVVMTFHKTMEVACEKAVRDNEFPSRKH